jgi:putative colanic acid biosynthesis UDP-glucose lipid carrier transferase
VLKGKMSLMGPRPHAVAHGARYAALAAGYADRHLVLPGITGWAQVNGHRGETDTLAKMQRRIDHDLAYLSRTIAVVRPQNPGAGDPHRLVGSQRAY